MTTGQEVFDRAMRLLGYTDIYGQADSLQYADLYKRGLPVVNQIYSDLWWAGHAAGRGGMRRGSYSSAGWGYLGMRRPRSSSVVTWIDWGRGPWGKGLHSPRAVTTAIR